VASVIGRPSIYTDELAEEIAQRHERGESLRSICSSEGMPTWTSVWRWQHERPSFRARLVRARQIAAQALAEEAHERLRAVQDTDSMAAVGAARELARSAQWLAERYDRDTYGTVQRHEVTQTRVLTDDELRIRTLEALAARPELIPLALSRQPDLEPALRARGLLTVQVTPPLAPNEREQVAGGSPPSCSGEPMRDPLPREDRS